jgi:hypothetical protein
VRHRNRAYPHSIPQPPMHQFISGRSPDLISHLKKEFP